MPWALGALWVALAGVTSAGTAQPRQLATPSHAVPEGAPHVVVHPSATPELGRVVIFLHGWRGCAAVLAAAGDVACREGEPAREGWDLAGRHAAAGVDSTLLVPQLAYRRKTGHPGRFREPGFFDRWIREILPDLPDSPSIALVAHSAGFETAAAILDDPARTTPIRFVVLLDALYAAEETFARWLQGDGDRHLVSLYAGHGSTARANARLLRTLQRANVFVTAGTGIPTRGELRQHRAAVRRVRTRHADFPHAHLTALLQVLPWWAVVGESRASGASVRCDFPPLCCK